MAKQCYRVCVQMGLQYMVNKRIETVLPSTGAFDPEELQIAPEKVEEWLELKRIQKVVVEEDTGEETPVVPKTKTERKKGNIWKFDEEQLAELTIEELNMKIQQVCSSKRVPKKNRPEPFEDAVEAIEFLIQDK